MRKKEDAIMVKVASLFSQILHHFPRVEFESLVKKHKAEYKAKGFSSWAQFVAMIFCHLAGADSLREITGGLKCCLGKIRHLGIFAPVTRSTLAYANQHRPAELFQDFFFAVFQHLLAKGGFGHRKAKFRFKNPLLSLDATTISLCLSLFPWAKFRRAKGGVKVHVLLDHDHYMPSFVRITPAREHEIKTAWLLNLNPGSIVAMDKAFNDYELFAVWTEKGVFFVTRLKDNADYRVVRNLAVPPTHRHIISDKIIQLTGLKAHETCPHLLRRILIWDEENKREIVLLTNHLEFAASTIAQIYKDRWEIELFFKTLKQNLKIKTFIGTSENALHIQIWTALISLLALKWLHYMSKAGWSFSNMAAMLRLNLFTYRDLTDWLNSPLSTEPIVPSPEQILLPFAGFGQATPLRKGTTST
jgi:hypothetical protein